MTSGEMSLEARDIHVTLGDVPILKGTGLSVPKGKMIGLIGPNGAGKTTLLRAILGLAATDSGQITLNGAEISNWTLKDRARKISYAAQGAPVHWPLDVAHIISLGRIPHLGPWQKISDRDREIIHSAMVRTDVLHLSDRLVTTLSGGERACVMLARAMVAQADYICVDEPIASLDPYHQLQVMNILQALAGEGHGVLIILHDLSLAGRYCHELVLMTQGKILASGPPADVLCAANLDRAYHVKASQWQENGDSFLVPWKISGQPERD